MMDYKKLVMAAFEAMEMAYVPYSHFKVGAALLGKSGTVYTGCNVEIASYGATNCAERTAIFKAISEGERTFDAIAIVSSSETRTYPCGICRQVIAEFGLDIEVVLGTRTAEGEIDYIVHPMEDLLPHSFTQIQLNGGQSSERKV